MPEVDDEICNFILESIKSCDRLEDCSCTQITTHSTDVKNLFQKPWMNQKESEPSIGAEGVTSSFSVGAGFGINAIRQLHIIFDTDDLLKEEPKFVCYVDESTPSPHDETINCAWEQEFFLEKEIPLNRAKTIVSIIYSDNTKKDIDMLKEKLDEEGIWTPFVDIDCRLADGREAKTHQEVRDTWGKCQEEYLNYIDRRYNCELGRNLRFAHKNCTKDTNLELMQEAADLLQDFGRRNVPTASLTEVQKT